MRLFCTLVLPRSPDAQELAYRRRANLRKTPDTFKANAPTKDYADALDPLPRLDPGLLTVAKNGPGRNLEFALNAEPADGRNRLVVGKLLDQESMALLARLANLPVVAARARLGGKAGMPLVKVTVVESRVSESAPPATSG